MNKLPGLAIVLLIVGISLYAATRMEQPSTRQTEEVLVSAEVTPPVPAATYAALRQLPMHFEEGNPAAGRPFTAKGPGYHLALLPDEAVLRLLPPVRTDTSVKPAVLRMRLVGGNPTPTISGREILPGKSNYLIGNNPAQWRTNVSTYGKVFYEGVYPGIDVVYYGNLQQLEYDFIVAPGTNPDTITLDFDGAERMTLDESGNLILHVQGGQVVQHAPVSYQEVNGVRQPVTSGYVRKGPRQIGFEVDAFDPNLPLVIDPEIVYATYLSGNGADQPRGLAVDAAGNRYIVGNTTSTDFPTVNPIQDSFASGQDIFVAKLNFEGTALLYATYLGGDEFEFAAGIGLDAAGNAYIAGETRSENFPVKNAVQPGRSAGSAASTFDAFVAALNADGSDLIYSTYLGGSNNETAVGMGVDAAGNTYVTGTTSSVDFRVASAYQDTLNGQFADSYVAKFTANGDLAYATYLGGRSRDEARGMGVDGAGNAYVVGQSSSADFPLRQNIAPFITSGGSDGFVTKLNTNGQPEFASFFGFFGRYVALDEGGQIYVWGSNGRSQPTAPVNAFQPTPGDGSGLDGFLVKLNPTADAILYASYLGGSDLEQTNALVVDADDNAYVYGITRSSDFPVKEAVQPDFGGDQDMFLAKVDATGGLEYATYLGGRRYDDNSPNSLAVDAQGNVHFAFQTDSGDLPTATNAFQSSGRGAVSTYVGSIGEGGKNILVQDWRLNPMANTMMKVFIVHALAPFEETQLGEITTDANGKATLPGNWFKKGDHIKLTRRVHTEPAVKSTHDAVDNTAYIVTLDNANVDPDGVVTFPESEDVPEQTLLMNHTTVQFNLVVSVEWDASPEFLNSVVEGFRSASNYLYDVTNAQLHFNKIAVYDDKLNWDDADVRIYASNQEWPRANAFGWKFNAITRTIQTIGVFMPREFTGNKDTNRNLDVNREPSWANPFTARTLGHEFGHYGLGFKDEYADKGGQKVLPDINLGFMDSQYSSSGPLSSEMSGDLQYRTADRHVTAQWAEHGMSCWDFFIRTFEVREGGKIIAPLFPPFDGRKTGPNDPSIDVDVGSRLERLIVNEAGGAASQVTRFTHPSLQQSQGIIVRLEKTATGRRIDQGKTNNQGFIRLLGVHAGDEVNAYVKVPFFGSLGGPTYESLIANLTLGDFGKAEQDTLMAAMRKIEGDPASINTLSFLDQNRLRYQIRFQDAPSTLPEFQHDAARLPFTAIGNTFFSTEAPLPNSDDGLWRVWSTDAVNEAYFIDQSVTAFDQTGNPDPDQIASADGSMETTLDLANPIQQVAVLTSAFPPLRNGLPDIAEQAGDVHTLALFPGPGTLQGDNSLLIRYQDTDMVRGEEASIRLYRWNPDAVTWQPMGGIVDTEINEIVAPITQEGTYAAFTTEQRQGGTAPGLAQISPANGVQGATGVRIIVRGQNFLNGARVSFSGTGVTATNVLRLSDTELQITVDVAANAPPGPRDLTVTNPDGLNTTAVGAFEVLAQGSLTALLRWDPPAPGETLVPPGNLRVDFGSGTMAGKQATHRSSHWLNRNRRASSTGKHQAPSQMQTATHQIDEIEPNNHPDDAQVLTGSAPVTVNGNVEVDDEGLVTINFGDGLSDDLEDLFRVTITEPGLILSLDGFTSDTDLYLIDEEVTTLLDASDNIGASEAEFIEDIELPVGTYVIGVSIYDPDPIGGPATPYTLTVLGTFEGDTGDPPVLLSYNIYRSLSPDPFGSGTRIATADAMTTTYLDALPSDGMYHYQVTAVYDQGESDPSDETVLSVAVAVEEETAVPTAFVLAQNYPNPFNPKTTIPYEIETPGRVLLQVFNVLGQHVQTVVDSYHAPGRYEVSFDARGLPSGLYLYQLEAGSNYARQTMLLLK